MSAVVAIIAILSIIVLCLTGFLLYKHISTSDPRIKLPDPLIKLPVVRVLDVQGEWALTSARDPFPDGEWDLNPAPNDYIMFFGSTADLAKGRVVTVIDGVKLSDGLIQQRGANMNEFEISWPPDAQPLPGDASPAIVFSPPPGSSEMPVGSTAVIGGGKGYIIMTKISNRPMPAK